MEITIYNEKYAFSEKAPFTYYDENFPPQFPYEDVDCPINDIKPNHFLYGWLENFYQLENSIFSITFTHIKFTR